MQVQTTTWQDLTRVLRLVPLTDGVSLHVPEHEARRLPNYTVGIPGKDGEYIIGLDVFHQLHCLNMFRKLMYPERYGMVTVFANGTRDEETTLHFGKMHYQETKHTP